MKISTFLEPYDREQDQEKTQTTVEAVFNEREISITLRAT